MLAEHTDEKLATLLVRTLIMANRLQSSVNIGGLHPKGIALEIGFSPTVVVRFAR
jgi:hypothetical protein